MRPTALVWVVFVGGVGGNPRRPPGAGAAWAGMSPTSVPLPSPHPPSVGPVPARGPRGLWVGTWDHSSLHSPGPPRTASIGLMEAPSRWVIGPEEQPRTRGPVQPAVMAAFPEATRGAPTLTLPRPSPGPHPWPQTLSGSPRSSTRGGMASHPPTRHTGSQTSVKPYCHRLLTPVCSSPVCAEAKMSPSWGHLSTPSLPAPPRALIYRPRAHCSPFRPNRDPPVVPEQVSVSTSRQTLLPRPPGPPDRADETQS